MLDAFVISFIMMKDIKNKFIEYVELGVNNNDLNIQLENDIINNMKSIDCGICLSSLANPKYKYELYECPTCYNAIHYQCMERWQSQKNEDNSINGCIYCKKTKSSSGF